MSEHNDHQVDWPFDSLVLGVVLASIFAGELEYAPERAIELARESYF
jgi:hypothetical protein